MEQDSNSVNSSNSSSNDFIFIETKQKGEIEIIFLIN
jgi:hypothetical protein